MEIMVKKIAGGADTAAQGEVILEVLNAALNDHRHIVVSFDEVTTATSSFTNAAFVPLLDVMTLDQIRQRIRIVRSTRQINEMIKTRLARTSGKSAA